MRIAVICALLLASALTAAESARTILVAPFENQSTAKCMVTYRVATNPNPNEPQRSFQVDRYSEAPRAIFENALVKVPGVTVIERQRVDAMMLEGDFGAFSGLVDGNAATRLGRMLGANVIVMGTIMRVDATTREFSGYGVATKNTTVTASVRVRAVDISSGAILASEIVDGSKNYPTSQFSGVADSDVAYAVLEVALAKLTANDRFLATLAGTASAAQTAAVAITPRPTGCDCIVDGVFRGNTPVTLDLPTGKPVTVRLEKAGHQPWERAILPGQVPTIAPELTRLP